MMFKTALPICLILALFSSCAAHTSDPAEKAGEPNLSSGSTLIESPEIWEAIEKGTENSPEITYARKISARIENAFQTEVSQLPEINHPSSKCYKLPPIDVVMNAEGKITKSANRAKSCWVTGTRTALKVIRNLNMEAPPEGLLKNGKFKFSWVPEIPPVKAQ